jgi:hypothetical protein
MANEGNAYVDQASYDRALQKIEQALSLLGEVRADLQSWAPPSAINDIEAAEAVLRGVPARLPARD